MYLSYLSYIVALEPMVVNFVTAHFGSYSGPKHLLRVG